MNSKKLLKDTFKKKREAKSINQIYKERSIEHFAPTVGSRPIRYEISDKISTYALSLDKEIDKFLNTVSLDQYNEAYFDSLIHVQIELWIEELNQQKIDHQRCILGIKQELNSYLITYNQEIEKINKEISKNLEKLEEMKYE